MTAEAQTREANGFIGMVVRVAEWSGWNNAVAWKCCECGAVWVRDAVPKQGECCDARDDEP